MQPLTIDQLLFELDRRSGLIPSAFDIGGRKLVWIDLETYHPYEGFLHRAIDRFAALKQSRRSPTSIVEFVTDSAVLRDRRILADSIYPTGFIFHAGRCGSTLLTRILARDRRHLVIGEAAAHNQVWLELTNSGEVALTATEENKQVYKHLLLAMGRKRLPGYEAHFIKFTSFNILFFNFISSVFPDVPAIFLYRKPLDILASYAKAPPGWFASNQETLRLLLAKTTLDGREAGDPFGSPANAVTAFFTAGLRAGESGARYLNYPELKPANLPAILRALNVSITMNQLTTMQSQFRFDSKVDHRATAFVAGAKPQDTPAIEGPLGDRLKRLYDQLVRSGFNVVPPRFAGTSGME